MLLHDDGSRPRMYDLRIGDVAAPEVAIECIGAVDPLRTATWNVGPGRGSFKLEVEGDWHIVLRPDAVVKRVRARLPTLLQDCIEAGVEGYVPADGFLQVRSPALHRRLSTLKIDAIGRYDPGVGRIYLGMTGYGGAVDPTGREVPGWIGQFLRADDRRDVLVKLTTSGAEQRHVFVIVSFGGAPWLVESYLGTQTELLPQEPPDLPAPVDAVWILHGSKGLRWDGTGWRFFNPVVPVLSG